MTLTERKYPHNLYSDAVRSETLYWGDTDDYTAVFEMPNGSVVIEESTDEQAYIYWYDCDGTFDAVMAAFTEED